MKNRQNKHSVKERVINADVENIAQCRNQNADWDFKL